MAGEKNARAIDLYFSSGLPVPKDWHILESESLRRENGRGLGRLLGFVVVPWDWVSVRQTDPWNAECMIC